MSSEVEAQKVNLHEFEVDEHEFAVLEFEGDLRNKIISSLRESHLRTGRYASDARLVSAQSAASLSVAVGAAGAGAASSAFSSSLFMATANPATLMPLGSGVGSAVLGTSGIVGQAAFIPVASSLPVVAPLLAVQALTAAFTMQQFKTVNKSLDVVKGTLNRVVARIEATQAGELMYASEVVDELYEQYEMQGMFSTDMLARLATAERDIRSLNFMFRQLIEAQDLASLAPDLDAVNEANHHAYCSMLASLVDLRIAHIRVAVDMQENPKSVPISRARLRNVLEDRSEYWPRLFERSTPLKQAIEELKTELASEARPDWMPTTGRSKKQLDQLERIYTPVLEAERDIRDDFRGLMGVVEKTKDSYDSSENNHESNTTLVYWREDGVDCAFVTDTPLVRIQAQ